MRTIDTLDATGFAPLDCKLILGQWRIAIVTALKIGTDEYETKLRWYLPKTKRHRKVILKFRQKTNDQTYKQSKGDV